MKLTQFDMSIEEFMLHCSSNNPPLCEICSIGFVAPIILIPKANSSSWDTLRSPRHHLSWSVAQL